MSALNYTNPKGYGAELSDLYYYSQAVRLPTIPPSLKLSGQGGWNPSTGEIPQPKSAESIAEQVDLAFANVDDVLRSAGSKNGWADVYLVRTYLVGLRDFDSAVMKSMGQSLKKWCPGHKPVLTAIEVKGLALEAMRIEAEVEALAE